jgi:DNA-binding Lrp family transcriptional regulator
MKMVQPPKTLPPLSLDDRDRIILSTLSKHGRASFKELGAKTDLSPNAVADRVSRLKKAEVIRGFGAAIDPKAFGHGLEAFIDIKLQQGVGMEAFETALRRIQGVREATVLTGAFDARLRVDCADPAHLGLLIEELRTHAGVQETSSTVICRSLNL